MKLFVIYYIMHGVEYYVADIDTRPHGITMLKHATKFATAREAYNAARPHSIMQLFRVGRRPVPVNLRGSI
jgi:hypothetical protein